MIYYDDTDAIGCDEVIARLLEEYKGGVTSRAAGMHSVGGWHTRHFRLGKGWLGEAMLRRIEREGLTVASDGSCWGNILPAGSEYSPHVHFGYKHVAVWCLTDSGGVLHMANSPDVITMVVDQIDRLTIFEGSQRHWVPKVDQERFTVAANLDRITRTRALS